MPFLLQGLKVGLFKLKGKLLQTCLVGARHRRDMLPRVVRDKEHYIIDALAVATVSAVALCIGTFLERLTATLRHSIFANAGASSRQASTLGCSALY